MGSLEIMKPAVLIGDEGDRWMRSVMVTMTFGDRTMELDAYRFEEFVMALGIRHLAIHPRTREIKPHSIPADRLSGLIERKWSEIDSWGIHELATSIQRMCVAAGDQDAGWRRS